MIINTAPVFSKIEILVENHGYNSNDVVSITKMDFKNSSLTISGNYLIITVYEKDELNKTITMNDVYEFKNIKAYKTYE